MRSAAARVIHALSTLVLGPGDLQDSRIPMCPPVDIHEGPEQARPAGATAVPLLLIIGPPGVGKSSVAREVSMLLEDARIAFAYVDRDDFGVNGLLLQDPLADLNELLHERVAAGAQRLVVAWRVESGLELARVHAALGWAAITVCRLRAEPDELMARIDAGHGSFQRLHLLTMALDIAPRLERQAAADILLATDASPPRAVATRAFTQWTMQGASMTRDAAA
jgi:hypothetical protein